MTLDVAHYRAQTYAHPPCWKLVRDVYTTELSLPVDEYTTINSSVRAIAAAQQLVIRKGKHGFVEIAEPIDFAVVLLGASLSIGTHHAGVYWQGGVLHATDESGVVYQDMASLGDAYRVMQFWARPETIAAALAATGAAA